MGRIRDLRIGTKLAVTSGLTFLLIAGIIFTQMSANAGIREANGTATRQHAIAQAALSAKAALRGMQVGVAETRLASGAPDLKAAEEYLDARLKSANNYCAEILAASGLKDTQDRVGKLKAMIADYAGGAKKIVAIETELIGIEAKRGAGEHSADSASQVTKLHDEVKRVVREVMSPTAKELDAIAERIIDDAKLGLEAAHTSAVEEMAVVQRNTLMIGFLAALLLVGVCIFSVVAIGRPMQALTRAMLELADGNFAVVLPGLGRKDEIGEVAQAVETFKVKAEEKARREADAKIEQDQIGAQQRKAEMNRLATQFEAAIGEIVETVSSASNELESSAGTLTSTAERAQQLTSMVTAASEEASANVQSVASATEELSSSISEISRQVQESARMAGDAVSQAGSTTERVSELSKAAARIGDVVELINTIAGQTNLLALNATIEAARAGEAGRGFAVVASEVKALAEQTAKATGEIGQQINGIQAATEDSVGAIREISAMIEKLSEVAGAIAAAVEEQGAATQDISRNVQQAAQGTQQVSSNITDVQRGAGETGSASSRVLSAAQTLSSDSKRLRLEVGKFLQSVRAA
jgi:methyl-accepting chemotaxis protein